eukprot:TRINITY_DN8055_c0_g7_i1.p1 TRINITY_DN8055_c0_g7~~TRINITY_DN8055_c0_g7_i1.p1  ORF type:complete len:218 (+),score=9.34 TRINITY_DN8055_c0_g7_i1:337-990(+)
MEISINAGFVMYCGSFLSEYLYGMTRLHNGVPIGWKRKLLSIVLELLLPHFIAYQRIPIVHKILSLINLAFGFSYALFPKALYPSLEFCIQGLSYGRHEMLNILNTDPSTIFGWLLKHGSLILYLSFKVLQWYYVYEGNKKSQEAKVPPPKFEGYKKTARGSCGLCKKPFKDPACLETSGCCFCYMCIYRYLRTTRQCPISGIQSDIKNIRRIRLSY